MMRPSRASASLPDYRGGMSIPSGNDFDGTYARASSSSVSSYGSDYSSSQNYCAGGFARHYDDTFKDKPLRRNQNAEFINVLARCAKKPMAWTVGAAAFLFMLTVHYRGQLNWILRSFEVPSTKALFEAFHDAQGHLSPCWHDVKGNERSGYVSDLEHHISDLEQEVATLKKERRQYKKQVEKLGYHVDIETLTARDFAWKEQVEVLQNATQRESYRSAKELFGLGPHHVKFTVILPSDEKELERNFIVEMAPLEIMPHSVHLFLQQVVHGLWNNAWFYLNGPHVIQGGPQASEDEEELWHLQHQNDDDRAASMQSFRNSNLEHLSFPEYSEKYPHDKWTLGFTGRPGGPDFYINKMDNRKAHGPGGQMQHDLAEYGDPCFAKVVDGFDVLEAMFREPTYHDDSDWAWFFEDPIHIVNAKIMENAPLKIEVPQEIHNHTRKSAKPLKKPKIDHQVAP